MIAAIPSAVLIGVDGHRVSVEVHVSNGLPGFTVVGLPDAAVRESRDRVRAALLSSGLTWPLRRVTVNLAPSGVRKGGAGLDLPIAIGVLVASGVLDPGTVSGMAFVGELGLDGSLRGVPGTVVLAEALHDHQLVVATESAGEAGVAGHGVVRAASALGALVDRLSGRRPWSEVELESSVGVGTTPSEESSSTDGHVRIRRGRGGARPLRGSGPPAGSPGLGGGGGRGPPPAHGRTSRLGEVHVGQSTPRHPSLSRSSYGVGGHSSPLGGRPPAAECRIDRASTLPFPPSRHTTRGHDRRRLVLDETRRDQPVPRRSPLPR